MQKTKDLKQDVIKINDLKELLKYMAKLRKKYILNNLTLDSRYLMGYLSCIDDIIKIINND